MRGTDGVREAIVVGPELELRVSIGVAGRQLRATVRDGVTIGRAAANDLIVDEPGVGLIHARVVPDEGGGFAVKSVGRSRLVLSDGTELDRMTLTPGATFYLGDAVVECQEIGRVTEDELLNVLAETDASTAPAAPVVLPRLVVCPACYKDMTDVPVAARFCPKCGGRLPPRDIEGFLIPPEESSPLYPVYKALREELSSKLVQEAENPAAASSLIILAYANALLNLGWKYEHGKGILRNVEEAARCYSKAGRLSEAWGQGR